MIYQIPCAVQWSDLANHSYITTTSRRRRRTQLVKAKLSASQSIPLRREDLSSLDTRSSNINHDLYGTNKAGVVPERAPSPRVGGGDIEKLIGEIKGEIKKYVPALFCVADH